VEVRRSDGHGGVSERRAATWRLDELIDMAESVRAALLRGG
jgi:hypothetical protein